MNKTMIVAASLLAFSTLTGSASAASNPAATKAFEKSDRNGNGSLNPKEFAVFIEVMAALGSRDALRVKSFGANGYRVGFKRADGNGDGKISLAETQRFK